MQRVELGEVEYDVAAKEMRRWVEERVEGKAEDRLFLLSHPPVITYGPRTVLGRSAGGGGRDSGGGGGSGRVRDVPRAGTSHGFSINVEPDMTVFHTFTSCGLHDVTMVSLAELAAERGTPAPSEADVRDAVANALGAR